MEAVKAVSILDYDSDLSNVKKGIPTYLPGIRSVQSTSISAMKFLNVSVTVPT
jgi:hypothetical protein